MRFIFLTIFISLQLGCVSLQSRQLMVEFSALVDLNQTGKVRESLEKFTDLCQRKHKVSCLIAGHEVSWRANMAIMQGASSQTQAHFVLSHEKGASFSVLAFDKESKALLNPVTKIESTRGNSNWALTNISFANLQSGRPYQLIVVSSLGELIDYRQFQSLATKRQEIDISLLSCMKDDYQAHEMDLIWDSVLEKKPHVLFMIGDNVYIDAGIKELLFSVDPSKIWQRHMETRNKLKVFRNFKLLPVFATWDDHDFGDSDGGMNFRYKKESREIFDLFFPMSSEKGFLSQGPGLARSLKISGQQFLFLDNRSFRSKKKEESHFGLEQRNWIKSQLKSFTGFTWLISGDQFFGGYHPFESFQGTHPQAFKQFIGMLKKSKRKVLFVSGDRHLSELMKVPGHVLGYPSYEFTSSPVHSKTYPGALTRDPNPNRLDGVDGKWNHMLLKIKRQANKLKIKVEDYDQKGAELFSRSLVF